MTSDTKCSTDRKTFTRNLCLECSKTQNTCCTFHEHYIPLTLADIDRIACAGMKLEEFATVIGFSKESLIGNGEEKWWTDSMIEHDGKLYRVCLKDQGNEVCFMLRDGAGCILGQARPNICRIYPFWISEAGKLELQDDFCYMHKQLNGSALSHYLELMNESESDIQRYFSEMKADFINNKAQHQKLVLRLLKE